MNDRVRLKTDRRREIIVEAINRLFAEKQCVDVITHGAVAKRCTVPTSTATVRYYFATKDDLAAQVVIEG